MLESLNYSFRNTKNIIWVICRIKQLRNYKKKHGVLQGPRLDKQCWRARLGMLRVKNNFKIYIKIYIKTAPTCFGAVTIIRERITRAC